MADFALELEQEVILSVLDFIKTVSQSSQTTVLPFADSTVNPVTYESGSVKDSSVHGQNFEYFKAMQDQHYRMNDPALGKSQRCAASLPSVVPIGAPWQQIYLLARRQKKIYVQLFDLFPIKCILR